VNGNYGSEDEEEEERIMHGRRGASPLLDGGDDSVQMIDDGPSYNDMANVADMDVEPTDEELEPEEDVEEEPVALPKRKGRPPRSIATASEAGTEPVRAAKKRGRPSKSASGDSEPRAQPTKRRRSQRSSLDEAQVEEAPEPEEVEADEEESEPKRRKTAKGKPGRKAASTNTDDQTDKPAQKKRGRPKAAAAEGGDDSVLVPRGPPLPKARGLLITRREVPGGEGTFQTRSGRSSFRPLAFWRNERVDYDAEVVDDIGRGRGAGRIALPAIKEVVRVDEPEPTERRKYNRSRAGGRGAGRRRRRRDSDSEDDDSDPPEPWEEDTGEVWGEAVVWQPEHEFEPPAPEDELEVANQHLAVSRAGCKTSEVRGATFGFAKTLSLPFFGSGVVDLPPGSEKRPKNSRKMHMTFFVFRGRLSVTVGETQFRISKGGMWFVPRGEFFRSRTPNGRVSESADVGMQATTTASRTTTTSPRASSSRRVARLSRTRRILPCSRRKPCDVRCYRNF
jgi:centromere protein C